jgi:hypothetical protein
LPRLFGFGFVFLSMVFTISTLNTSLAQARTPCGKRGERAYGSARGGANRGGVIRGHRVAGRVSQQTRVVLANSAKRARGDPTKRPDTGRPYQGVAVRCHRGQVTLRDFGPHLDQVGVGQRVARNARVLRVFSVGGLVRSGGRRRRRGRRGAAPTRGEEKLGKKPGARVVGAIGAVIFLVVVFQRKERVWKRFLNVRVAPIRRHGADVTRPGVSQRPEGFAPDGDANGVVRRDLREPGKQAVEVNRISRGRFLVMLLGCGRFGRFGTREPK